MQMENHTTEFILLGLTNNPHLKIPLFLLFILFYAATLLCNGGMIALIHIDPRLWTPMYRFISHLSLVDICYSSTITPKMLVSFIVDRNTISFYGCMIQLYFYSALGGTEPFLLAAMGYDRYVAICLPLRYTAIMTEKVCILLPSACYSVSFLNAFMYVGLMLRLSFCGSKEIHHFFCDFHPLYQLSCTDTHINRLVLLVYPLLCVSFSTFIIFYSYASIFLTILKMRSIAGRLRAFSTCSSHFMGMLLFYGTALSMTLQPSKSYSMQKDMILSIFYTIVTSMLNPLIYSLRNKDIKEALKMLVSKKLFSQK